MLVEAVLTLLLPLATGYTVDSLLSGSRSGVLWLAALCGGLTIVGAGRRFLDTRAYSAIYRDLARSLVDARTRESATTGTVVAGVHLLYEMVEFLENHLPVLLASAVAFLGVATIIAFIDAKVMVLCLSAAAMVGSVYGLSGRRIFRCNERQNDEFERQVEVISEGSMRRIDGHFRRLMEWNIRLSDLETLNFSAGWMVMVALLVSSIVLVTQNVEISYGQKLTAIMYVFQYSEVVMGFPLFYQQVVRLREIGRRLSGEVGVTADSLEGSCVSSR